MLPVGKTSTAGYTTVYSRLGWPRAYKLEVAFLPSLRSGIDIPAKVWRFSRGHQSLIIILDPPSLGTQSLAVAELRDFLKRKPYGSMDEFKKIASSSKTVTLFNAGAHRILCPKNFLASSIGTADAGVFTDDSIYAGKVIKAEFSFDRVSWARRIFS